MLNQLFQQVIGAIQDHSAQQQHTGFDPSGLLNTVQNLFGQHAAATGQQILPASQDPYGDPADAQQRVLPASQDPFGDPADAQRGILPASRDPYGDPANRAA